MDLYKQVKKFNKIPMNAVFYIESRNGDIYSINYFLASAKANEFRIKSGQVSPKRTIIKREEYLEFLTMYGYRIWKYTNNKAIYDKVDAIRPMSKIDVMMTIKQAIPKMDENDEVYIYKVFGTNDKTQIAIKRYIKKGDGLIKGDL